MKVSCYALVLSGIIQFLMGLFRLGIVGYFIPTSVIHGMLASIGITLILKQIPHALGDDNDIIGDMAFRQIDGENTFSEILYSLQHLTLGAIFNICSFYGNIITMGDSKNQKLSKA